MLLAKTSSHADWRMVRLYYHDPIVPFLISSLKPFIDGLEKIKMTERYFWKRSDENGRHIQLFVRCSNDIMESLLLPNLISHFNNYIDLRPSIRSRNNIEHAPDNSLHFQSYAPNENDWGGVVGLPIAERFFQASSNAVLNQFALKGNFLNSEQILETTIILHAAFLKETHRQPKDIVVFYENLFFNYTGEAFSIFELDSFFEKQSTYLRYFVEKIWQTLQEDDVFAVESYNKWLDDCFFVVNDLKITYSERTQSHLAQLSELWDYHGRLLRFVNNQLGLKDKDEALFFYIMIRCFELM